MYFDKEKKNLLNYILLLQHTVHWLFLGTILDKQ